MDLGHGHLALFGTMLLLASVPGASVIAVSARAAAGGFRQGLLATLGIMTGDLLFISLAALGMHVAADALGSLFSLIRAAGGGVMILLGLGMLRPRHGKAPHTSGQGGAHSSFVMGFLLTLGDQKALLFYLGILPAYADRTDVAFASLAGLVALMVLAIGIPKLLYAAVAAHAGARASRPRGVGLTRIAGFVLICTGVAAMILAFV